MKIILDTQSTDLINYLARLTGADEGSVEQLLEALADAARSDAVDGVTPTEKDSLTGEVVEARSPFSTEQSFQPPDQDVKVMEMLESMVASTIVFNEQAQEQYPAKKIRTGFQAN